jgi:hypothetical protein
METIYEQAIEQATFERDLGYTLRNRYSYREILSWLRLRTERSHTRELREILNDYRASLA